MRTSSDGGSTWSTSRAVSGASLTSRVGMIGVATVSGSDLIAVFEATENGRYSMNSMTSSDDGKTCGNHRRVYTPTDNGNNAGAPQVINVGETLVVSFMTGDDTQLGQWTSGAQTSNRSCFRTSCRAECSSPNWVGVYQRLFLSTDAPDWRLGVQCL